ncbi:MAG TPA: polysaccharide lyase family 8 super-sandwich domain-containing protein, partial [Thermoanaerobaculia bacterium]
MKRLLPILLLAATPLSADLSVVRKNFVEYSTAAGASRLSTRLQHTLAEMERAVDSYTVAGFLLSDGSWTDINYNEVPSGVWSPWEHVKRLSMMAKAYRTPGQHHYADRRLLGHIDAALRKTSEFYGPAVIPEGNWWFWTLGIPLDLGPTLVLMRGDIDQALIDDLALSIALRIGTSPSSRGIVGPVPTGQNLVWSAFNHMCVALVRDDAARMERVRSAMAVVTLPTSGDGVQSDRSFHQHGAQLYTGGYGGSFANDVAKYVLVTRGSAYELPSSSLDAFSSFVVEGIAWSIHGSMFDPSVIGRSVANPHFNGYNGVAALVQAAGFDSARSADIRAAAAQMLRAWPWGLPVELAGLAARVETSGYSPSWPSGHRHYYESDYTIHRRAGWFASVKMFSTRTKSGENTNGENLRGARQSDGRFHLSLGGNEYFAENVRPALDWSRLPGITVEQSPFAASDAYGYGRNSLAGGTGDGRNGVSAMDIAPILSSLRAKKSWFFFDDALVFLTSGITTSSSYPVETIINQWPLRDPNAPVATAANWIVADGVGYYVPAGGFRHARETRNGTWSALSSTNGDSTTRSATFLTMWIDHGAAPVNASAEYVIVPNVTAASMPSWIASNPIQILANTPSVSAVRKDQSLGIVFWAAGSFQGWEASGPAVIYVEETTDGLEVSAADPTSGSGTLRITLPGRYDGANATAYGRGTTLEVARNGGRTTTVKLTAQT